MRETELERAKKRIYVMDVRGNMNGEGIEKYSEIYNSMSARNLKQNKGGSELADQMSNIEKTLGDEYLSENYVNKSTSHVNRNAPTLETSDIERNITIQNNPIFEDRDSPDKNGNDRDEHEISAVVTKKGHKH